IFKKEFNVLRYYLIIIIAIYSLVNCFSIDKIIAENNIKRYERTGKIDLNYLENGDYDNLNQLRELSKKIEEDNCIITQEKDVLKEYIKLMDKKNKFNILEYNISKETAKKKKRLNYDMNPVSWT
ncbi:MAG: DUF4173 domain-containing protein, partial [Bacilli bacterium]|nr:DUF4173 domain-containing protein [Bacilli bacterium]